MAEEHEEVGPLLAKANGHAQKKMNGTVGLIESDIYEEENIFLFIPNIIGMRALR